MPEEIGIVPAIIIIALSGLLSFAIPYFLTSLLMSRDDKAWERRARRERREREIEATIDRKYRELQREVYSEIRNEIRSELRHELRYEIRSEFEKLERRLGGRIDAAGPALIGTAGAAPWETESGPRNSR
ncbi:MAG: hypothetical protein F4X22_09535 [Gemmatimonadales bacterium]|nr:hypothetical protein [Candidatus Palauibacter denitrificans]